MGHSYCILFLTHSMSLGQSQALRKLFIRGLNLHDIKRNTWTFVCRQNSDDIHIGLLSRLNEQLDSDAIETSDSEGWPNPGEQNEVIDLESTPHRTNNANIEEMVEIESSDEEAASSGPPSQIDDAEFARRLHLQEQEDHRRRLLTLAGKHRPS